MATQLNEKFVLAEDAALKRKFEGLKVSYPKERDVGVWFRWPNKEIRDVTWPLIALDLVDIVKASHREHQGGPVSLERADGPYTPYGFEPDLNAPEFTAIAEDWPTPYDLFYTVTVACKDPRHERELLAKMLGQMDLAPHRWGFIEIPEDGTVRRFETVAINDQTGRNSANDIEYRRVYTVKIETELFTGWVEDKLKPSLISVVLTANDTDIEEQIASDLTVNFE
ncbi:MAG: hypothetical protein ABR616_09700 [Dermatophilaceae bacterium]|nr:hypothetical protein [Intrasporangiaceae bacterium]